MSTRVDNTMSESQSPSTLDTGYTAVKAKTGGAVSRAKVILVRFPRRFVYAMTPTLIRTHFLKEPKKQHNLHATSWMDGIRGLASLSVFNFHYLFNFINPFLRYHTPGRLAESTHNLFLPPFCLLWDGIGAVNLFFFAVSGYVFPLKALQLMQQGPSAYASTLSSLSTSTFRRGFRLYLPTVVMLLFITLLAYIGGFGLTNYMFDKDQRAKWFPGYSAEVNPARKISFLGQMQYWLGDLLVLSNLWQNNPQNIEHDPHYWTIAYEYRASLQLNACLLMLARCKPVIRLAALCGIGTLYGLWGRIEGPLFFFGAAAAQWDVMQDAAASRQEKNETLLSGQVTASQNQSSWISEDQGLPSWTKVRPIVSLYSLSLKVWRIVLYLVALYFLAYPRDDFISPAPGYTWVNAWIPASYWSREFRFPKTIGCLLLLWLLRYDGTRPGYLRALLTGDLAQYCGKIMFSFYLVHGTILHVVGYAVPWWVWSITAGNQGDFQWSVGIFIGWALSLGCSFWAADVFDREVMGRCVSFTRWVEAVVFVKS